MNNGFLALTITILLGVLVLFVVIIFSYPSINLFYSLDRENKSFQSKSLAMSCLDLVLLKLVQNQNYSGNESLNFENGRCEILPVENLSGYKVVKIRAYYLDFPSYLSVLFDLTDRKIRSIMWNINF